jgi:hypothetical protein
MPNTRGKNKLLEQGLPVASNKTIDALYQVYAGEKWGIHLSEVRENLIRDNPNLVKFIENQISKFPRELHNAMFEVVRGQLRLFVCRD